MNQGNWIMAVVALALSACAGQHVRPDKDYASVDEKTVRVAFDQNGETYPRTVSEVDWSNFRPSFRNKNFGGAFSLRKHYEYAGGRDWAEVQSRARQEVAAELNGRLKDGDLLVVLIHGFNNRYEDATKAFSLMRDEVTIENRNVVFLEVFWDGLQLRNKKAISGYATFWPDALTYSNLAGNYGLRALLDSVEKKVDLRFVTHSRGIAVALAALADPEYDSDIKCPSGEYCREQIVKAPALDNPNIQSIQIAAFAPAVGTGHLVDDLDDRLPDLPLTLLAGVNPQDFATSKYVLPSKFWGDTSLGSDPGYVLQQQFMVRKKLDLRVGLFGHGDKHALEAYFYGDPALTDCFFATIGLQSKKAEGCVLIGAK